MSELNQKQYEAVHSNSPKILCLAGAGVGKTYTLLHRINRLVDEGVDPSSILVLTFTNAAAQNMKDRFQGEISPEFKTFHAFCYSIVASNNAIKRKLGYSDIPRVITDEEYKLVLKQAQLDSGVKLTPKQLRGENLSKPQDKFNYDLFRKFLNRAMIKANVITFDKLCYDICEMFVEHDPAVQKYLDKYTHIMLDEFQDTDIKQWKFATSFSTANLFVVGDALQALYAFRGADSTIIKELASNPEWETIKLVENYRSTSEICNYANNMSHYADDTYRVEIQSDRHGSMVVEDTIDTLDAHLSEYLNTSGVTAVLCRTNREVYTIRDRYSQYFANYEKYLKMMNAVAVYKSCHSDEYAITYLSRYLNAEEYIEFLRQLSLNTNMTIEQFKALFPNESVVIHAEEINNMKSLLQQATCPAMEFIYAASMYDLDYEDVAVIDIEFSTQDDVCHGLSILILKFIESTTSLYIGTIHSAKGLEYDNVIVYNVDSNTFPLNCEDNWNLYYVGVTRAKNNLCVLKGK